MVENLPPNSLSVAHFRPQRMLALGKGVEGSTRSTVDKPLSGQIAARTAMLAVGFLYAVGFSSCGELSVTQQASHTRWVFGRAEGFPSRGKLSATKSVDLAVGARIARVYRSYL